MGDDESEDSISFSNFLASSNKKMLWESIYKLVEGLYALHYSGLIHRNISLDTIYFDGEAYRQGEKEIFKIGDFNWSIYLCSLSNVFTDDLSSELIKDNYHFFRAPECLPSTHIEFETSGETYQSDLFSLGLVISFLILEIEDIEKYINSQLKDRLRLYEEIYFMLENFHGYPLEKEILLKLICVDVEERFQNVDDLMSSVRELLNIFKYNFIQEGRLPINFNLERNSPLLRQISNILHISIDARQVLIINLEKHLGGIILLKFGHFFQTKNST
jgi:serine/threonine protein kinase